MTTEKPVVRGGRVLARDQVRALASRAATFAEATKDAEARDAMRCLVEALELCVDQLESLDNGLRLAFDAVGP